VFVVEKLAASAPSLEDSLALSELACRLATMEGSRWSMLRRISANMFIRVLNSVSSSSSKEKRAFSYRDRKSVAREGGVIISRELRWEVYSRRPMVAGRWSSSTAAASGIGGSGGSGRDASGSGS